MNNHRELTSWHSLENLINISYSSDETTGGQFANFYYQKVPNCPNCQTLMIYDYSFLRNDMYSQIYKSGYYCPSCGHDERVEMTYYTSVYPNYPVIEEGWQVCPLCNGTGIKSTPGFSSGLPPCEVCEGKRIIDVKTGKPPEDD